MAFQDTEIPSSAAANSLFDKEKRVNSFYEQTISIGTDAGASALATLTPMGLNSNTAKWGKWLAPDPSVTTITLTGATGGTCLLGINGAMSNAIAYNATAATLAAVIRGMGFKATVTLGTLIYTVTWTDDLLTDTIPTITADLTNITGDAAASATPTAGTAAPVPHAPTNLRFDVGTRTEGTWTITHGAQTTADIAFAATSADVEAALAALATPVIANCHRPSLTSWLIEFDDYTSLVTLPTVSVTDSLAGGADDAVATAEAGTALVPDPTILTIDVGTATGGTYTIDIDGVTTAPIAFDAADATVDAAILAATGIVTTTASLVVTCGSLPQLEVLPNITGDITELTGAGVLVGTVAGTSIYGLDKIRGFLYPETTTLSASEDTIAVVSTKGEYFYDDILATIAGSDEAALKVALKDGLIAAGMMIQGLPGIA